MKKVTPKTTSKGKSETQRVAAPDALTKTTKKGSVELKEEELKQISGGGQCFPKRN